MYDFDAQTLMEQMQSQLTLLQETVAEQKATLAQQQAELAQLQGVQNYIEPTQTSYQTTSRRNVLKRLAIAAVGTAAGVALLSPVNGGTAQAAGGATPNIGWFAFPGPDTAPTNLPQKAGLAGSTESNFGDNNSSIAGVYGFSATQVGVRGVSDSGNGVVGVSKTRNGVHGESSTDSGVFGKSTAGNGISGSSLSSTGVFGSSTSGNGVSGVSTNGIGVTAQSTNFTALAASSTGGASSIGVFANSTEGKAVYGRSVANYGAVFSGGKAPLRLEPSTTQVGPPISDSHEVGEFFVDKEGKLFYCMVAGTPGRWLLLSQIPANQ